MIKKIIYNRTLIRFLMLFIIGALLTGCTQDEVEVKVNGLPKSISEKSLKILTNTNRPDLKVAILPEEKGDIEIEYDSITYKVFEEEQSGILYFNNGEIHQYELTQNELNKIKMLLNNS